MKHRKLPHTDSIRQLASFWDTHDLTDFEEELEEVTEPIFVRERVVQVPLQPSEADALQQIAQTKGISKEKLVREWVLQKLKYLEQPARRGAREEFDAAPRTAADAEQQDSDRVPARRSAKKRSSADRGKRK